MLLLFVQILQRRSLLERHETVPLGDAGPAVEDNLGPGNFSELGKVITQLPVAHRPGDVSDEDFQRTRCGGSS